jgi:glycosyltransferase involved in cell wall biosynthesis
MKMKKRRILLATGIFPPDIGGPAAMLEALALGFARYGYAVTIITYSDMQTESNAADNVFKLIRILRRTRFHYLEYFFKLCLSSFKSDLIYVTETYSVGFFVCFLKKFFHKKYILRFVGDSAWESSMQNGWIKDDPKEFIVKKYSAEIERLKERRKMILLNADRVIVVSDFLKSLAISIGVSPEKITLIYNSVDFIKISGEIEKKSVLIKKLFPADAKLLLTVCRLVKWKGIDSLVRVFSGLLGQGKDIYLLIAGDGPERENLFNLVEKLKISQRVKFLGAISKNDVFSYMLSADLFILNSQYEGFSHTLLEAMSCGLPIIASRVGGNPELIENEKTGLLFTYNSQEEIEKCISRIFSDRILAENFARNSKEKIKDFSWEKNILAQIEIASEAIGDVFKK